MTGDGYRGEQVRAVLFAAIMVVSMVAMGASVFAGSAAAEVSSIDGVTAENVTAGSASQTQNVTLVGVNRTDSNLSDIDVELFATNTSVEGASVSDAGSFGDTNVSAGDRSNGGFFVEIDGNQTVTDDITVEVTLNTSNADPQLGDYTASSANGASAEGSFDILSDGPITVDADEGTDDGSSPYATIQAAIDNAESGDTIEVRSGNYDEQIVINRDNDASNLTIRAADGASPTIKYSANDGTPTVAVDQDGITLEGFNISRSNSDSRVAQTVRVTGDDVQLIDNTYEPSGGANDAGVAVLTDSSGTAGNPDVSGVIINDVMISGGEVITNQPSQTGVLVVDDGAASFGGAGSVSVSDVTFAANADSTQVLELDTGGDIVDIANTFGNNEFNAAAAPSETAPDSSINGSSIDGIISTTIQDAVDRAASGSTVEVASGIYDESVAVSRANITVESPNAGLPGTNTSARSTEAVINSTSQSPAVVINRSEVTIDGFEIWSDGQDGIRLKNSSIDDIAIINNRITDVDGSAYIRDNNPSGAGNGIQIQFGGTVDNTVDNVSISHNLISGVTTADTKGRTLAIGINVLPRGNNITRLNITENTITGLEPGASESEEEVRGISIDTQVTESGSEEFEGGTDDSNGVVNAPVIAGNNIGDFSGNASSPFEAAGITFFGDNAGNTDIGVNNFKITSNTIENITNAGGPSSTVLIGGEYSDLGDDHQVTNNNLVGSGIVRYSTSTPDIDDALNATSNWWGSANGPNVNANTYNNASQGGYVSGSVEFTPWLDNSTDNEGTDFAPVTNESDVGFASIQAAVDSTDDTANTIQVRDGTYSESVVIKTSDTTVRGVEDESGNSPVIVGDGENVGSQPHAAIHVNDGSGPVRNVTVEGFTVENPNGKYGIFAGTGSTNKDPDGIGGLVIRDNVVQDVSTQSSGSALTGGPAGIGIRADYGTDGNPGIEISNNEIDNVENLQGGPEPVGITLKSFTGDAGFGFDSNGSSVTDTSSPPATDTDIANNEISNISSNGGFATKGISVSGEFKDVNIISNNLSDIESPGGDARAITLSENGGSYSGNQYDIDDDGTGERIGPQEFNISANTISSVNAADARSVNLGGYEEFGDHTVSQNTINDGAVTRFAGDQPGYQPGDGDALNLVDNTFAGQNDQLLVSDPSQSADLDAVLSNNAFEGQVVTTEDNAGNINSISGAIQPAVNVVSDGGTVSAGSGTYNESVTVDQANITIASVDGLGEATIDGSGIGPAVDIQAQNVTLTGFTLETDSGDGVGVGDVDAGNGDIDIALNNIADVSGVGVSADSDGSGLVDAGENWWGSEDGPNGEAGSGASNVATQPFLTTQVGNLQSTPDGTPRQFATDLRLGSGLNTLAFPAPSERTLNETIDTDNVETIYAYDNSEGTWLTPGDGTGDTFNTSMKPGALDVFVVVVEDGKQADAVIEFENEFSGQPNYDETDTTVSTESWNLVGAAEASDNAGASFQGADVLVTTEGPYRDPNGQPFEAGSNDFSPYGGYWVYADGESGGTDEIVSATYDGLTLQEYLESVNLDD